MSVDAVRGIAIFVRGGYVATILLECIYIHSCMPLSPLAVSNIRSTFRLT